MKDSKYYKKYFKKDKNKTWLSKILISIIIILLCLIITNFNNDLKESFKKEVLEKNISFTKINQLYEKYVSKEQKEENNLLPVSSKTELKDLEKEEYNGSYKIKVGNEYPVSVLTSGIIVYIGDKDDLNNTIIIQGNDGIDIWYSNIYMTEYSLYDYVSKGDILGSSNNDEIIITIMKDGKKISIDEYFI